MTPLHTTFAGLELKNPIVVSSSGLTDSATKNRKLSEAGAGAIVLKSLFEEQILQEAHHLGDDSHPEESDYLAHYIREYRVSEYLQLIKDSKQQCDIPIIASINCYDDAGWTDFARQIEDAGADALEINLLTLQTDVHYTYGTFEQRHINVLKRVKEAVKLPVIMKLGNNLTNPVALISQLQANGAAAVVLFNRFYQPDINIEKLSYTAGPVFSCANDFHNVLRWTGIASAAVKGLDFAASGGVHTPQDPIKAILAGATAVYVCSAVYQESPSFIGHCLQEMSDWMSRQGMKSIDDFKGRMGSRNPQEAYHFEREQFVHYYAENKD